MLSISWKVTPHVVQAGGKVDVVREVHWECFATEGGETARVYGSQAYPAPGEPFSEFSSLTQDEVLGWLGEEEPGETANDPPVLRGTRKDIEATATAKLERQKQPQPAAKALSDA